MVDEGLSVRERVVGSFPARRFMLWRGLRVVRCAGWALAVFPRRKEVTGRRKIVVFTSLGLSTPIDYAAKVSVKFLTSQM